MRLIRTCSFILVMALWPRSLRAASWIHFTTPYFDLYTTSSESEGQELIRLLESAQRFLSKLSFIGTNASQDSSRTPVRIIALSSREEYVPFRVSPTAFGYFRHSPRCNYIVLQDIRPEHRQAALHEYVHLMLRQAGLKLPLWLNEGLADFYSSFETDGLETRVGGVLLSRMRTLSEQSPIELSTLFDVISSSPFYRDAEQIPIFYAESWALVHLLATDTGSVEDFPRFVALLSKGISPTTAFAQVYGKSVAEIQSALRSYLSVIDKAPITRQALSIGPQAAVVASDSWEQVAGDVLLDNVPRQLP